MENKIGLVLSGGGAKGAYHAGVVRALSDLDIEVDGIAGASIGALNGSILSVANSVKEAASHIEEVWLKLAEEPPIKNNHSYYRKLLEVAGLVVSTSPLAVFSIALFELFADRDKAQIQDNGLLSASPIKEILDKYLDMKKLKNGIPLYVSVFEGDISDTLLALLRIKDTKPSEFIYVQSLPEQEQKKALLASAALPILYSPQKIGDREYSDGGQGGWFSYQGNTPITPLIENGYSTVIVTHLSDGSLLSRADFPDTTIIEIRPSENIQKKGGLRDVLSFTPSDIERWIEQGYSDTIRCVKNVVLPLKVRRNLETGIKQLRISEENVAKSELEAASAINRLKRPMRSDFIAI